MRGKLEATTTQLSQDTRHSWYNVFTGWSPTGSEVVKTFFYPLGHTCPVQLLFGLYCKEKINRMINKADDKAWAILFPK